MSKKTLFAVLGILALAALVFWILWKNEASVPASMGPDGECLLFQSADPEAPCYFPSAGGQAPSSGSEGPAATSTAPIVEPVSESVPGCGQGSVFERNDCIARAAEQSKDKNLCSYIEGSLARAACERGVAESPLSVAVSGVATSKSAYEAYMRSYATSTLFASPIRQAPTPVSSRGASDPSFSESDLGMTVEKLYERTAYQAELAAYSVYPYQSKPGDMVRLTGSGFALDSTNTVYVGGQSVSGLASEDGMTLNFPMPSASEGMQEVWVTNARGSTRVASRPIYAVVSSNPVPPPVITSVSPANPTSNDIVTISGTNLTGLQGVFTTLGRAPGNSLSFKPADLEYVSLVNADGSLAGSKVSLYIYVFAEGGMNDKPFIVDVQF